MVSNPSDPDRARVAIDLSLLLALSIPVIFYGLGRYSIVNGDEAIYHGIAESMVESGNWFDLRFRGIPRPYDTFMNAPVQYWIRATLIEWFGSNLWTMRIGSALFGFAAVIATYSLGTRIRDRATGLLAGAILLTTLQFVAIHGARTGELDTGVAFLFTAAVISFLRAAERESRAGWIVHHLCLVGLVNWKLPIVLIPLIAESIAFAAVPRFRRHLKSWLLTGLAIAPIGLAWHVFQTIRLGDTAWTVMTSMLGHATGAADLEAPVGFGVNVAYYGEALLFGAYPFSLVYPVALASVLMRARHAPDRDRWLTLAAFLVALAAFHLSVAAHLRQYLIPAYPLLSVFVASWISDLSRRAAGLGSIAAAAAIGALSIWLAVDFSGFNPFATQANQIPMQLGWRSLAGVGPVPGVIATGAILALALWGARSRALAGRSGRCVAVVLGGALLLIGGARVALPLRHLDHQSEMASIRQRIDRDRAANRPIALPIEISDVGIWRARYYFARDFQIHARVRPGSGRDGVQFLLTEKPAPRDQSSR